MNFLGHIYLSPNDDEVLLGNFIADSVKGNPANHYTGRIVDGIKLHRAIDEFTDNHPLVKQGVNRFRKTQGRYATVVIDVIYDHVLASNWAKFHAQDLNGFTEEIYTRLHSQSINFPPQVQRYFPYMRSQNWLFNYQYEWGIVKTLEGLDRRTSIDTEMYLAVQVYKEFEDLFFNEFQEFIEDAKKMVRSYSST